MQDEGEGGQSSRSFKISLSLWVSAGQGGSPHLLSPQKHSRTAGLERSGSKEKRNYLPSWAIAEAVVHLRAMKDPAGGGTPILSDTFTL